MDTNTQKVILLNAVKSMVIELNERLGDENPWAALDLDALEVSELALVKKALHELLYAPPVKR